MQNNLTPKPLHVKQRTWQIFLPIGIAVAVMLALAVWAVLVSGTNGASTARWAAISTIWLVMPALIALLIFIAAIGGLIYLNVVLLQKTPGFFAKILGFFRQVNDLAARITRAAVQPVLKVNGWQASWQSFWRGLGHLLK
jgi:heme/copper-type cytochrome/quinol oxidase subunit 2